MSANLQLHTHPLFVSKNVKRFDVPAGENLKNLLYGVKLDDNLIFVNGQKITDINYELNDSDFVVVKTVPRGDDAGQVLALVATVALAVVAPYAAGAMAGATSGIAYSAAYATILVGGSYLISSMFQPDVPSASNQNSETEQYSLSQTSNSIRKGESMPFIVGKHKIYPDHDSRPFNEFSGEDQILFQTFNFGVNQLVSFSDLKIGENALSNYDEVDHQWNDSNGNLTLFPANVDTIAGGELVDLNDDLIRTTSTDTTRIGIDLESTLLAYNSKGKITYNNVKMLCEYRAVGDSTWVPMLFDNEMYNLIGGVPITTPNLPDGTITLINNTTKPFRKSFYQDVTSGQYEIRLTRLSDSQKDDSKRSSDLYWSSLKSYQPDTSSHKHQNRLAVKIKASGQLQGTIQNINAIASASCPVWDGSMWIWAENSNPAYWFRHIAKGYRDANNKIIYGAGLSESLIDDDKIKEWAAWCDAKGLEINYIFTDQQSPAESLELIAKVGRAVISHSTGKLGVVYDADGLPISQVFSMSNIIDESFSVSYVSKTTIDSVTVNFINEDLDYTQDQVTAVVPGITNPVNTVEVNLTGITTVAQAGKSANLIAAEQFFHKRRVSFDTDVEGLVVEKGDVISVSHDAIKWDSGSARKLKVIAVEPVDNHVVRIIGRDEDSSYYTAENGTYEYDPKTKFNADIASITDVKLTQQIEGQAVRCFLTWANGSNTSGALVRYRKTGTEWIDLGEVTGNSAGFYIDDSATIDVEITAVSFDRNKTNYDKSTYSYTIYGYLDPETPDGVFAPDLPIVSGLELMNHAPNEFYEFEGRHISVAWNALVDDTETEIGGENEYGVDTTFGDTVLDYEIRIYDIGANTLLRTVHTHENTYVYTYEDNFKDHGGDAKRSIEIHVYARGHYNQISDTPASIVVSNPVPVALAGLSFKPTFQTIDIQGTVPKDPDFAGVIAWVSDTSGFTPTGTEVGLGNCVFKDSTYPYISGLTEGTTYYIRLAGYDRFDSDISDLNISSEVSITTVSTPEIDISEEAFNSIAEATGLIDATGKIGPQKVGNGSLAVDAVGPNNMNMPSIAANTGKMNQLWVGIAAANNVIADEVVAGGVTANSVGTNEIIASSANIKDAIIKEAHLDNAIIKEAHIKDLSVGTIKIKNNAVSVMESSESSTDYHVPNDNTSHLLLSTFHSPAGKPTLMRISINAYATTVAIDPIARFIVWRSFVPSTNPATGSAYTHDAAGNVIDTAWHVIVPEFYTPIVENIYGVSIPPYGQINIDKVLPAVSQDLVGRGSHVYDLHVIASAITTTVHVKDRICTVLELKK